MSKGLYKAWAALNGLPRSFITNEQVKAAVNAADNALSVELHKRMCDCGMYEVIKQCSDGLITIPELMRMLESYYTL